MRFGLIVLTCLFILTLLVQGSSLQLSALTESSYKLPYPAEKEYIVTQGNNSPGGSHSKKVDPKAIFAFDFGMLDGDPIVASRSGKVLAVQDNFQSGKCDDPSYYNKANYIVIDHGDGTSALYLHLKYKSVKVNEGEWVEQGQIIAEADATGYVCGITGNHLHFQVQETPKDGSRWYTQSISISFSDKDVLAKEKDAIPKTGQSYKSDNAFLSHEEGTIEREKEVIEEPLEETTEIITEEEVEEITPAPIKCPWQPVHKEPGCYYNRNINIKPGCAGEITTIDIKVNNWSKGPESGLHTNLICLNINTSEWVVIEDPGVVEEEPYIVSYSYNLQAGNYLICFYSRAWHWEGELENSKYINHSNCMDKIQFVVKECP